MTIDGGSVREEDRVYRVLVHQIRLQSSVFLLWNAQKALLCFGGATNSEFGEFLLHFPMEEIFQPMR